MNPEELAERLAEVLSQPTDTLGEEVDILEQAHEVLQGALKRKEG
ncbi:hypothetical protein [Corynebacterium lowii]|uniref:Uncharacterized protein n=1 Tax=Corynebacterium lowii TaxID=1544413 RepID=A0A0Q0Z7W6_9CORY|nr:hypothetical protein [Corynebacterium lowii]KQB85673.1 hypothetical protein Clow_01805 [Corynebacterium lowii]MDP9850973.1 hypothetical protein [Corynebacterium lowii]